MAAVVVDITVSLDGYVTAPGADVEHGLGVGGEDLHTWVYEASSSPVDKGVLDSSFTTTGAIVMGRNLYDVITGPHGWTDDHGYGYEQDQSLRPEAFVVTHRAAAGAQEPGFTLVDGGVEAAVAQARGVAGELETVIMGGGSVCRQALALGIVDVLRLHLSPIVLGGGTPLFDGGPPVRMRQREVLVSPYATHLTYDVERSR